MNPHRTTTPAGPPGFSLAELILSCAIISALAMVATIAFSAAKTRFLGAVSSANLRQLVAANYAFAADYGDRFCPTWDMANRVRWHGARRSGSSVFEVEGGFLGEYLEPESEAIHCPLFADYIKRNPMAKEASSSFENGAGGYGYNDEYLGREPGKRSRVKFRFNGQPLQLFSLGNRLAAVPRPAHTVMFATTAFAKSDGIQEYPIVHPRREAAPNGGYGASYQPSLHFRCNSKAIVAWADGHITFEPRNEEDGHGPNYYGGDNSSLEFGWFGPDEQNGFWNPSPTTNR